MAWHWTKVGRLDICIFYILYIYYINIYIIYIYMLFIYIYICVCVCVCARVFFRYLLWINNNGYRNYNILPIFTLGNHCHGWCLWMLILLLGWLGIQNAGFNSILKQKWHGKWPKWWHLFPKTRPLHGGQMGVARNHLTNRNSTEKKS